MTQQMKTHPMQDSIPEGYRQDAKGNLVAEKNIRAIDIERDELVRGIAEKAKVVSTSISKLKREAFGDIAAFIDLSAEQYRVAVGGLKGNVTLYTFDGQYKVIRSYQEYIRFDERLQAAKTLIDECLTEWTEGARSEVRAIINDAFRMDHQGNIRTGQVLQLRRLKIDDERWQRAMIAIGEAVQVVGSKSYVRVYERDADGEYQAICLDIAGVRA